MKLSGIIAVCSVIIRASFYLRGKLKKKLQSYEELLTYFKKMKREITVLRKPIDEVLADGYRDGFRAEKDDRVFSSVASVIDRIKLCKYDVGELLEDGESIIKEGIEDAKKELTEKGPLYIKLGVLAAALFTVLAI